MKNVFIGIFLTTALLLSSCSGIPKYTKSLEDKPAVNVLMLMNDNFGLNYMLMLDAMELKGWKLTHLGTSNEVRPCLGFASDEMPGFIPDYNLEDYNSGLDFNISGYDALVTAPGTGSFAPIKNPFDDIIGNPDTMTFIKSAFDTRMPFFAMCMGVIVPLEAGILEGREVTGTSRLKQRIMMADGKFMGRDYPPVISDNLVTGVRGQYYNYHNMNALARTMENYTLKKGKISTEAAGWTLSAAETENLDKDKWIKQITGSPLPDGARDGTALQGRGLFVCGYSFGRDSENSDGIVLRTSADGNISWSVYIGGPGNEYLNAAASDGRVYYTAGYTTSEGNGGRDGLSAAFDKDGNLLWYNTFGGSGDEEIMDMILTNEGPLLFGHTSTDTGGEEDLMLLQLDLDGNLLWEQRYGGRRSEIAGGIMPFKDGYALSGSSGSFNKNTDFHLIMTDDQGRMLNEYHYGGKGANVEGFDWVTGIFTSPEGNPVMVGYADARSPMGPRIIGADNEGKELFNCGYKDGDFYNYGYDGFSSEESLFILGTRRDRDYDSKIFLVQTDGSGVETKHYTFDSPERDWAVSCAWEKQKKTLHFFGQSGNGGENGDFDLLIGSCRIE